MKRYSVLLIFLLILLGRGVSESLWAPSFEGYIFGATAFRVGETLIAVLDPTTVLSFRASRIDSKSITIELEGGEAGSLFSFLPSGSSSSSGSFSGDDKVSIKAEIAVRVVSIDEAGTLSVEGTRRLVAGGSTEVITVSGLVDPDLVGNGKRVASSAIADLTLSYMSLLDVGKPVLTGEDLVRADSAPTGATVTAVAEAVSVGEAGAAGAATTPEATTPSAGAAATATTPPPAPTVSLSEEKREELLLIYLNRIVDLILRGR